MCADHNFKYIFLQLFLSNQSIRLRSADSLISCQFKCIAIAWFAVGYTQIFLVFKKTTNLSRSLKKELQASAKYKNVLMCLNTKKSNNNGCNSCPSSEISLFLSVISTLTLSSRKFRSCVEKLITLIL